jgi:GH43 family beta-xylosidase
VPNTNGSQTINLAFATGDFRTADYKTRLMYIDASLDPTNADAWVLTSQAYLQSSSANGAYGPGSGGFFTVANQTWFAYGGYDSSDGQGGESGNTTRTIRVQEAPMSEAGLLLPNTPVSCST